VSIKQRKTLALLLILACVAVVSCNLTAPFPTATPIGVTLDTIPTRFQGDWALNVPPLGSPYEESYAEYSDWYTRLIVHIDESATDCKILELQEDEEQHELQTATSVTSMYQGIEIRFETMTIAPLDYFNGEHRNAGFSHGETGKQVYLGIVTLVPWNSDE